MDDLSMENKHDFVDAIVLTFMSLKFNFDPHELLLLRLLMIDRTVVRVVMSCF